MYVLCRKKKNFIKCYIRKRGTRETFSKNILYNYFILNIFKEMNKTFDTRNNNYTFNYFGCCNNLNIPVFYQFNLVYNTVYNSAVTHCIGESQINFYFKLIVR